MTDFYNMVRPNEEDVFTKWRQNNRRHITVSPILSAKRMFKRVFKSSIYIPEIEGGINEKANQIMTKLIDLSFLDPNSIGIEWPYNPEDKDMPLSIPNSYPQNLPLQSETIIKDYTNVIVSSDELCIFHHGYKNLNDNKIQANVYIACDKNNYYRIIPYYSNKKVLYEVELWYFHGLDRLPVFKVPSINIKGYNETYAWGAYEYLDEAVIALSSDQINRIRNVLPKLVINADLVCPTCNGGGTVGEGSNKHLCGTCHGSGSLKEIGDFSVVKTSKRSDFDRQNPNPISYVQPAGDIRYSMDVWKDLIDMAEKQLCTDLLEGTGNESSLAKELRLEPRQDLLVDMGESLCKSLELYINNIRQLINPSNDYIRINAPAYYESKTPDLLKLYVEQSIPGERQREYMMLVKSKYRGNQFMIDVHYKAMLYAPLLLYKTDEADSVISMGAYEAKDIKRRDYAIIVLSEIISKNSKLSNKALFDAADDLLIEWGIMETETEIIDISDEIIT
jgi:hypothetical protein